MTDKGLVFISYKSEDRPFALQLRDHLRAWGWRTWLDVDDIPQGAHWPDEIQKGLEAADVVVGVLSPRSILSRNVKNEWDWTIVYKPGRLFLLMMEVCVVPMHYVSINRTDFTRDHVAGYTRLGGALDGITGRHTGRPLQEDPHREYLQQLYERINKALKDRIIRKGDDEQPEPLHLRSGSVSDAVDPRSAKQEDLDPLFEAMGITQDTPKQEFSDFAKAFEQYEGWVLLLGEPGAGKTITLLHFAREAVVRRIQDPTQKLPMLAIIPEWQRAGYPDLAEWMGRSYGAAADAAQAVREGRALLLLDGLDELPRQAPIDPEKPDGEQFDPRSRFMGMVSTLTPNPSPTLRGSSTAGRGEQNPYPSPPPRTGEGVRQSTNQVVVTCRVADYEQMGEKIGLRGAVTLKPLDEGQIKAYLQDVPGFWETVEADAGLKEIAQTPLLLSIMAFAFRDRKDELKALSDLKEGALRDAIFTAYIEERYAHEARKLKLKGQTPPFTLEDLCRDLGWIALMNAAGYREATANVLTERDFWRTVGSINTREFIAFCEQLDLIVKDEGNTWRFIHLRLRDTLAHKWAEPLLNEKIHSIRLKAIGAVGGVGDTRAVPHVISLLRDVDVYVRSFAASALGQMGDEQAVPHLIPLLKDAHENVRCSAADALGTIKDLQALPHLVLLLRDEDSIVRSHAAEAVGNMGMGGVPHLLPFLTDTNKDVRASVANVLGQIGREALPHLLPLLKDEDSVVRSYAANALGKMGDAQALGNLIPLLKDTDSGVQNSVIIALGEIRSLQAILYLVPLLKKANEDTRYRISHALGELGSEALPHLLPLLKDEDSSVRASAANAIGEMGSEALPHLLPLLKDEDSSVRASAAYAIGIIKNPEAIVHLLPLLRDEDWNVHESTFYALEQMNSEALPHLLPLLKDNDTDIRSRAAYSLRFCTAPQLMPHLLPLLRDSDSRVRASAIGALGSIKDSQAVPSLLPLLKDTDWVVRHNTAFALGEIKDPQAVPNLLLALKDDVFSVRQHATEALGQLGSAALAYLLLLLKDEDGLVREGASDALWEMGDADAVPQLETLLDDPIAGEYAARSLEGIGNERGLRLAAAWREKHQGNTM